MKKFITTFLILIICCNVNAQEKIFTKTGKIVFDATVPSSPEKIEGTNKTVTCVIDIKSGAIQFAVLMKGFLFERALMEEHFNENYVESSKFPKTEFKGAITNNATVNYTKDGVYNVKVKGKLTMHGETKEVETDGKISVKAGKIYAAAAISVLLEDYKITVPTLVADKVAKRATINVDCVLEPLK
jgi:polyisoprenoid-binding protein YceI